MPKGSNQRLKLYYILKILKEETDDEHGISMSTLIQKLNDYEIDAERKSVGSDIKALCEAGYDISNWKNGREHQYFLLDRDFELPEIKLLVDAVQVSKFISKEDTDNLIKKLETLVSKYQAKELNRQVYVSNRVKTESKVVIINIDYINTAIMNDQSISFEYYDWDIATESMVKRTNGDKTGISPLMLIWDDENYYMVAYESASQKIKHYRVDKMKKIKLEDAKRQGKDKLEEMDIALYSKRIFGMFSGERTNVKISMPNNMYSVLIDRFGKENVWITEKNKDTFTARVSVDVSDTFFGWVVGLGRGIKIVSPEDVVEKYNKLLGDLLKENE